VATAGCLFVQAANVFVFHRNELMPIMAFDKRGNFIRAWGRGMFKTTHFLRVDRSDAIWVTDRGYMEAFKFNRKANCCSRSANRTSSATTRHMTPSTVWPTSP
jgi:hypothetical protein